MARIGYRRHGHHRPHRPFRRYTLFERMSYFSRKHPIAIGVILIIAAIVLFRLSFIISFLNNPEVFMWSIIVSIGLFIAGLLVLKGYWKKTVPNTHIGVTWRRR